MQVWKWNLQITDRQTLNLPVGAELLAFQMQREQLCLWALVDEIDQHLKHPRTFAIYGTGNQVPDNPGRYRATVQSHGGDLVWHVFEIL